MKKTTFKTLTQLINKAYVLGNSCPIFKKVLLDEKCVLGDDFKSLQYEMNVIYVVVSALDSNGISYVAKSDT
jgi:hypothetical protein